ncbi:MAG: hypothetical protein HY273_07030, partial [Gammaproteobacteria bacterium]|nr:hypothetical protein [Gammaproteobacteria bacterium]
MQNKNSKFTVAAGFSALIAIMVLVALVGFLRFASIHNDVNNVTLQH